MGYNGILLLYRVHAYTIHIAYTTNDQRENKRERHKNRKKKNKIKPKEIEIGLFTADLFFIPYYSGKQNTLTHAQYYELNGTMALRCVTTIPCPTLHCIIFKQRHYFSQQWSILTPSHFTYFLCCFFFFVPVENHRGDCYEKWLVIYYRSNQSNIGL